jgi:CubicO group peptidase (beta-lactamase class C family)
MCPAHGDGHWKVVMSSMRDLPHAAPEEVGVSSERLTAALRAATRGYVDDGSKPSSHVAVARCGKVIYDDCYGYMDAASKVPIREDTIYRLASMTKPITCVAAMICYERGCFQLDDPLSKYCPEWAATQVLVGGDADAPVLEEQHTPITIKHLFTHTGGLPPLGLSEAGRINARLQREMRPANLAELCEALAVGALSAQPGEKWQYGACLTVLGRCIEVWSGRSFDVFLQEEIFDPLTMVDTGFKLAESKLHRLHANFLKTGERQMEPLETKERDERLTSPGGVFDGSGGLVGSTADYMKFAIMLCNKGLGANGARILGPRSVEHMSMNHLPGNVDIAAMGVQSVRPTNHIAASLVLPS